MSGSCQTWALLLSGTWWGSGSRVASRQCLQQRFALQLARCWLSICRRPWDCLGNSTPWPTLRRGSAWKASFAMRSPAVPGLSECVAVAGDTWQPEPLTRTHVRAGVYSHQKAAEGTGDALWTRVPCNELDREGLSQCSCRVSLFHVAGFFLSRFACSFCLLVYIRKVLCRAKLPG